MRLGSWLVGSALLGISLWGASQLAAQPTRAALQVGVPSTRSRRAPPPGAPSAYDAERLHLQRDDATCRKPWGRHMVTGAEIGGIVGGAIWYFFMGTNKSAPARRAFPGF